MGNKYSTFNSASNLYKMAPYGAENRRAFNRCECCSGWWCGRVQYGRNKRKRLWDKNASRSFKRRARAQGKKEINDQLQDM